jgi:hypothetical protein
VGTRTGGRQCTLALAEATRAVSSSPRGDPITDEEDDAYGAKTHRTGPYVTLWV